VFNKRLLSRDVHGNGIPIPMGIPWEWEHKYAKNGNGNGKSIHDNGNGNGREWECCKPFPHISTAVTQSKLLSVVSSLVAVTGCGTSTLPV